MSLQSEVKNIAKRARQASRILADSPASQRDEALRAMARGLLKKRDSIIKENKKDLSQAKDRGHSKAFLDRLSLNDGRIKAMADSLLKVAELKDMVGEIKRMWRVPSGLWIGKMCVPIGVIAIIYESRPNVTTDCAGLCLKSANAVVLRGGSEAIGTNIALYRILEEACKKVRIPEGSINMVETTDRAAVNSLLKLNEYVDLVIPRGGEGLIKEVTRRATMPVIKHYKGICHTYVDREADLDMAEEVCFNAKVQRPGVCNAMETLLVHQEIARLFLPRMIKRFKEAGVQIRGCSKTRKLVDGIQKATSRDWSEEYLDLILSVKVVGNLEEAIEHINRFGSSHSDAIITEDYSAALRFLRAVDSACVYVNASTRFTDGYQFGMGAEIGISTDRIGARGPMGLEELLSYKYIILGSGQIRG